MQIKPANTRNTNGLWFPIILLTVFFFLLELSFFIQCNKAYLSDFTFVSSHINIPSAILPGILYFMGAQFAVHAMYALLLWLSVVAVIQQFKLTPASDIKVIVGVALLGLLTVATANQYYFPNSKFAELTRLFLPVPIITQIAMLGFGLSSAALLAITLFYWVRRLPIVAAIVSVLYLAFIWWQYHPWPGSSPATEEKPNIILVGVDSLRPDFLGYYGHGKATPFFDQFLNQASAFSEAVTPLARTFPSWVSVLTGQYPRQNHIRFNLASQQGVDLSNTLPAILRRHGYATVFATDETRFSNIDAAYGFDRVITPPMGLNDFLIGTFNDFPLSNLVVNSVLGKWLFPYSYANRPAYFTYNPDSFLQSLRVVLKNRQQKPLMMAVHFCLPHYPYLWSDLDGMQYSILERYEASVQRVDKQVGDFFQMLQQAHVLDHAVVILMSDHGEALELRGDRLTETSMFVHSDHRKTPKFYPPSLDDEQINQSAGHGTDVLGLPQYHSLLAFRVYGARPVVSRTVPGVVSLLDIKPTVLQLLGIAPLDCSGISLKGVLYGQRQLTLRQPIYLESDYTPEAIRTVYPETRSVMLEGIKLFQIDKTSTLLTVKPEMGEMIIQSKQFATIYDHWMLALYPQSNVTQMPILINLATGQWTNDLQSPLAQHSPASMMLKKLRTFYGKDLKPVMAS